MNGIIIAAGRGVRMGSLTEERPKCLLDFDGKTILENTIDNLKRIGCDKIIVVTGYKSSMIRHPDIITIYNDDYVNNNILHSLMYAKEYLNDDVVVSYSDIWVESGVFDTVVNTKGEIIMAIDNDWMPYYEGRTDHPYTEAENAYFTNNKILNIGKHLNNHQDENVNCGEFIGLWYMTSKGSTVFSDTFSKINDTVGLEDPFQQAAEWQKAYITDMVQYLIDSDFEITCAAIERGWAEIDTLQDYQRLPSIAHQQNLHSILNSE